MSRRIAPARRDVARGLHAARADGSPSATRLARPCAPLGVTPTLTSAMNAAGWKASIARPAAQECS
jgi:hypothetical protein